MKSDILKSRSSRAVIDQSMKASSWGGGDLPKRKGVLCLHLSLSSSSAPQNPTPCQINALSESAPPKEE